MSLLSHGSTRTYPARSSLEDISMRPVTGPAVFLTQVAGGWETAGPQAPFSSPLTGGFRRGTWERLSAGGLCFLSGPETVTLPGLCVCCLNWSNYIWLRVPVKPGEPPAAIFNRTGAKHFGVKFSIPELPESVCVIFNGPGRLLKVPGVFGRLLVFTNTGKVE